MDNAPQLGNSSTGQEVIDSLVSVTAGAMCQTGLIWRGRQEDLMTFAEFKRVIDEFDAHRPECEGSEVFINLGHEVVAFDAMPSSPCKINL